MPPPHQLLQHVSAPASHGAALFAADLRSPALALLLGATAQAAKAQLPAAVLFDMALAATAMLADDSGHTRRDFSLCDQAIPHNKCQEDIYFKNVISSRPLPSHVPHHCRPALSGVTMAAGTCTVGLGPGAASAAALLQCHIDRGSDAVEVSCGDRVSLTAAATAWHAAPDAAQLPAVAARKGRLAASLLVRQVAQQMPIAAATAATATLSAEQAAFATSLALQSASSLQQAALQRRALQTHKAPAMSACAVLLPASASSAACKALYIAFTVQPSSRKQQSSHELTCSSGSSAAGYLQASGLVQKLQPMPSATAGWLTAGSAPALQTIWLPWRPQLEANAAAKPAKWAVLSFQQACPLAAICQVPSVQATALSCVNIVFRPSNDSNSTSKKLPHQQQEHAGTGESTQIVTSEAQLVALLTALRPEHLFCVQRPLQTDFSGAASLLPRTAELESACRT